MKKFILPVLIVFFSLCIMDFVINGIILIGLYKQIATILRPASDISLLFIYIANIVHSVVLVSIYNMLANKGPRTGTRFGILYGLSYGFGIGLGTYAMFPITAPVATAWIISGIVEFGIAGLILGYLKK